jgi:hypothetical protein
LKLYLHENNVVDELTDTEHLIDRRFHFTVILETRRHIVVLSSLISCKP